jgi:hypothetical protein
MHMDDLWFDLAIRGEPDLQDDVVERLHLLDGAEPDREPERPAPDLPPQDAVTGLHPAPANDCC